jgi:hypothetical protein
MTPPQLRWRRGRRGPGSANKYARTHAQYTHTVTHTSLGSYSTERTPTDRTSNKPTRTYQDKKNAVRSNASHVRGQRDTCVREDLEKGGNEVFRRFTSGRPKKTFSRLAPRVADMLCFPAGVAAKGRRGRAPLVLLQPLGTFNADADQRASMAAAASASLWPR